MLFDSIQVGSLKLKNRIVIPGIHLAYCPGGAVNDRLINFYQARARGGAGLIMIGGTSINKSGLFGGLVSIHDDQLIPGHISLVNKIKEAGACAGIQLMHTGRYSFGFREGLDVVAPSPFASRYTGYEPRELSGDEILMLIRDFGQAARRGREAGYDLVEFVCNSGYLVNQFLSPLTNQRNDEYGGTAAKRRRFGLEVLKEIRRQIGDDFPVSIRLGGNDFMPGGAAQPEIAEFARDLESASANMINVTGGWHESPVPQITAEVPRGAYSYLAANIKSTVSIPVASTNRINDPDVAEKILRSAQADLISIGRGFLADSEWGLKARQGKASTIRKCIACMTCLDSVLTRQASSSGVCCAINARAGRESETAIQPSASSKKVLVVGAGPAGLEAARVAALRGHAVMLWEQQNRLGGQWNLAAIPPGKAEFLSLLDYYASVLPELGIKIELGKKATLSSVLAVKPDVVIVASGARPSSLNQATKYIPVVQAWEVLAGAPLPGKNIVVVGGGSTGCETALHLSQLGTINAETLRFLMLHQAENIETLYQLLTRGTHSVSLLEMGPSLASDMSKTTRWALLKQLSIMGVRTYTNTLVTDIESEGVRARQNDVELLIPADLVVMATGTLSRQELYNKLQSHHDNVYLIGDAVQPGKLKDAIHQAFDVAVQI